MEILRNVQPTARKEHKCEYCGGIIHVGEKYDRQTNVFDGRIYDWICHIECTQLAYELDKNIFDIQMNTWWCGWITIKTFVASNICTDSIDYAKACAQELLDKLREELP